MFNNIRGNHNISVNGNTISVPAGANVQVSGNKVMVDGKEIDEGDTPARNITVIVQGDAQDVTNVHGPIHVEGSARDVESSHGTVHIKKGVGGNVNTTHGKIKISGNVGGNVQSTFGKIAKGF